MEANRIVSGPDVQRASRTKSAPLGKSIDHSQGVLHGWTAIGVGQEALPAPPLRSDRHARMRPATRAGPHSASPAPILTERTRKPCSRCHETLPHPVRIIDPDRRKQRNRAREPAADQIATGHAAPPARNVPARHMDRRPDGMVPGACRIHRIVDAVETPGVAPEYAWRERGDGGSHTDGMNSEVVRSARC